MTRRAAGEGQLRQRANGSWEGRYTAADGRRRSVYGRTKKEASARLSEALAATRHGLPALDKKLMTGDWLTTWLEYHAKPKVRPSTHENYTAIVDLYLVPTLGPIPLARLQPEHVAAMLRDLPAKGKRGDLSPTTVRYAYKVLRIALGRAVKLGYLHRNVCELTDPPKAAPREVQPMSREDAMRLLASVRGDRWEPLYRLALATGLRQGELLALRWQDVNLDTAVLEVRHTLDRRTRELAEPKTPNARRQVAFDEATASILRAHKSSQRVVRLGDDYCFTSANGSPLDPRNTLRAFQGALAKVGLPRMEFHALRHTFATLLIEEGVDLAAISKVLGHANLATTVDLYGHLTPRITRRTSETIGAVLAG